MPQCYGMPVNWGVGFTTVGEKQTACIGSLLETSLVLEGEDCVDPSLTAPQGMVSRVVSEASAMNRRRVDTYTLH